MKTPQQTLEIAFRHAILAATGIDADPQIAASQNEAFGDYQSNAAMGLAKQVAQQTQQKTSPRQIAEKIVAAMDPGKLVGELSIAGPGFINVRLSPVWLAEQLRLAGDDARLGLPQTSSPMKVVVDYSGPNIAKPMHVGHLRGTIIGDCICRVLEILNHQVIRQNHVGDWGLQMGMVTYALEQMGGQADLTLDDLERLYKEISNESKDPSVRKRMAERTRDLQQTPKDKLIGWQKVRDLTLDSAQDMYRRLNVTLTEKDVRGESFYSDLYGPMVEELKLKGLATDTEGAVGIFPPGFTNMDGQPRPFIIQSRDGTYQYPTFDLAALTFRIRELKAGRIVYTHDSRQAEHFAMLFAVAELVGLQKPEPTQLEFAPFGTVLGEDGKPLKSRSGDNVKLKDLLDEAQERARKVVEQKNADLPEDERNKIAASVGIGAVKYADLSKDRGSDYVFSWDRMLAMDGNTGPYLQYAYARIRSIFRKAAGETAAAETPAPPAAGATATPAGTRSQPPREPAESHASGLQSPPAAIALTEPQELALAKQILRFGEAVQAVGRDLKPHVLCLYLYDLATRFSSFYEACDVLKSPEPVRSSRLALCDLTARTMALGLNLLGIEHPERM